MSSGGYGIEYPENPTYIQSWLNTVKEVAGLAPGRANAPVTELRWFKELSTLEHEYVVATCRRPSDGTLVYLLLERVTPQKKVNDNPYDTKDVEGVESGKKQLEEDIKAFQATLKGRSLVTAQRVADLKSDETTQPAFDSVKQVKESNISRPESRLIATCGKFGVPFSLQDLAELAFGVHSHDPMYTFFIHQCYWFAQTLFKVAESKYKPKENAEGDYNKAAGTYSILKNEAIGRKAKGWTSIPIDIMLSIKKARNSCVRIPVTQDSQREVDLIVEKLENLAKSRTDTTPDSPARGISGH